MITWFQRDAARLTAAAFKPLCRPGMDVRCDLRDAGHCSAIMTALEFDKDQRHFYTDRRRSTLSPPLLLGEWRLNWLGLQRSASA